MTAPRARQSNPATRTAIIDAFSRLLEDRPLSDIGVPAVLTEAGIASRTTFYRSFESRDAVFGALAERGLAETARVVRAVIDDPRARRSPELRQAVTTWMSRGSRHRGLVFTMVAEWPRIPELRQVYRPFIDDLVGRLGAAIEEDRAAGLVRSSAPGERLAAMSVWAAERAIYASGIGAEGTGDGHAVADVLVATHLAVVYGVALPDVVRDASRAPWLMT